MVLYACIIRSLSIERGIKLKFQTRRCIHLGLPSWVKSPNLRRERERKRESVCASPFREWWCLVVLSGFLNPHPLFIPPFLPPPNPKAPLHDLLTWKCGDGMPWVAPGTQGRELSIPPPHLVQVDLPIQGISPPASPHCEQSVPSRSNSQYPSAFEDCQQKCSIADANALTTNSSVVIRSRREKDGRSFELVSL